MFSCFVSADKLITLANSLDPDQDRRSVGPDLGPNCLKMIVFVIKRYISRHVLIVLWQHFQVLMRKMEELQSPEWRAPKICHHWKETMMTHQEWKKWIKTHRINIDIRTNSHQLAEKSRLQKKTETGLAEESI